MDLKQFYFLKELLRPKRTVYLDNNATTTLSSSVIKCMNTVMKYFYGNPSSLYSIARKSSALIENARISIAKAINANNNDIYFSGSATESNNTIIKWLADEYGQTRHKIIASPIEHSSVLATLDYIRSKGYVIEYTRVHSDGTIDMDHLQQLLDNTTLLVCCMYVNSELGTIQDIKSVVQHAKMHNAFVLCDCVQALGKIPVDVRKLGIDYATFSAHKLHGPKGVGAHYVKSGNPVPSLIHGGHQEKGYRAGTENVSAISGFAEASREIDVLLKKHADLHAMRQWLIEKIRHIFPVCITNTPLDNSVSNTLNCTFPSISNIELLAMLDYYGIFVSAGSACMSHANKPSAVLKAIGLSDASTQETIRISLGTSTTKSDLDYFITILARFKSGKLKFVNMLPSEALNDTMLKDANIFLLDVRSQRCRKKMSSIPGALEVSFSTIEKKLDMIPLDKHIVVICQEGKLSHVEAYYLKSKGYTNISSLKGGLSNWVRVHADLYQQLLIRKNR
jgi:cysteine desulfurase